MSKIFSINEIAKLNDSSIKSEDSFSYINYLDTSNLTKNKIENFQLLENDFPSRAKRKIKNNSILYSTVRPNQEHYGIFENVDESKNIIVSTGFTTIDVFHKEIIPKYLYYKLIQKEITNYLQTIAENSVSAYPSIKPSDIGDLNFRFPNIDIQQRIASVLSALDDKIELNNRINAELEAMAKTLYDYWFVQFDFPDANGKPYKSSGGKMVYNQELKREIPEGWEVDFLDAYITKIIDYRGRTPKKMGKDWSKNSEDIIALSAKHVKKGKFVNLHEANRVDPELYDIWMSEKLEEGDILMTSEAPCGEFFYLIGKTHFCLSQRLFAIRADENKIKSSYLYYELSKGNGLSQILGKQSGSTVFGIRQDELRKVYILKPPLFLQLKFDKIIIDVYNRIRNNDYQNQHLNSLRDWLLPMLMTGQIGFNEDVKRRLQ